MLTERSEHLMVERIAVRKLAGNTPVLSGFARGSLLLVKLIEAAQTQEEPTALYLDFQGVAVATSSYLRAGVLGFRDHCVKARSNIFPVVANANADIIEELRIALEGRNDAVVVCDLNKNGRASEKRIVGSLDDKQRRTLDLVAQEGEVDAQTLEKNYKKVEPIGATGWNNRLANLAEKALLIESRRGRGKEYRYVMELT